MDIPRLLLLNISDINDKIKNVPSAEKHKIQQIKIQFIVK